MAVAALTLDKTELGIFDTMQHSGKPRLPPGLEPLGRTSIEPDSRHKQRTDCLHWLAVLASMPYPSSGPYMHSALTASVSGQRSLR
jgi:hypothetical protein